MFVIESETNDGTRTRYQMCRVRTFGEMPVKIFHFAGIPMAKPERVELLALKGISRCETDKAETKIRRLRLDLFFQTQTTGRTE